MSVKFNLQIDLPDSLLLKLSTYSFIDRADWMKYGNTSMQLPAKHAKFINSILRRALKKMNANMYREMLKEMPEMTRRMIISDLGYDPDKLKGETVEQKVAQLEKDTKSRLIIMELDGSYQAALIPLKP